MSTVNGSYANVIDVLSRCKRVLITTHVRPDGDALGSTAALSLALKHKGIDSQVLLLSHLPSKYAFIFQDYEVPFVDVETAWPAQFPFEQFDALLVCDTGTWNQLPGLKERIANWPVPRVVLDHHLTQDNIGEASVVDTQAAAAGEIVAALLDAWQVPIDNAIATALYLAIVSDTGWFQFSNTRPYTMRLAARLIEAGVDTDRMYQMLYQNERKERVLLQARTLNSLELLCDGKVAVMTITNNDFDETGANVPDTENLINMPLQIRTVQVSMLLTEARQHHPTRVSLRSKGQIDVAKFAEQFGGGGHARASGLKLDCPLKEAHDRVVGAMKEVFEPRMNADERR